MPETPQSCSYRKFSLSYHMIYYLNVAPQTVGSHPESSGQIRSVFCQTIGIHRAVSSPQPHSWKLADWVTVVETRMTWLFSKTLV